ncbi:MAG TPA: DUF3209 family protein [Oligoflexus sp.]|uniref:DUF3209 family protein n=1 Tax=Oligoflexus sp. TaxID=1971216 RepID=UPI002D4C9AF6|nr:DUF3209 family protein [Oligoflexus sp.]HYX35488.1 DUF3209 family protein [Oligoflexus sp.]
MACHEIAALRLGMMRILGIQDPGLVEHELAELGDAGEKPGPLKMLSQANDMRSLNYAFELARTDLEDRLSRMNAADPERSYVQTLAVLNKKIESDLTNLYNYYSQFFEDLEQVHDHMHVIYPAE